MFALCATKGGNCYCATDATRPRTFAASDSGTCPRANGSAVAVWTKDRKKSGVFSEDADKKLVSGERAKRGDAATTLCDGKKKRDGDALSREEPRSLLPLPGDQCLRRRNLTTTSTLRPWRTATSPRKQRRKQRKLRRSSKIRIVSRPGTRCDAYGRPSMPTPRDENGAGPRSTCERSHASSNIQSRRRSQTRSWKQTSVSASGTSTTMPPEPCPSSSPPPLRPPATVSSSRASALTATTRRTSTTPSNEPGTEPATEDHSRKHKDNIPQKISPSRNARAHKDNIPQTTCPSRNALKCGPLLQWPLIMTASPSSNLPVEAAFSMTSSTDGAAVVLGPPRDN